ncbi:MAG: lytic murein transglycosylase [Sulfurovum sp.]|nr:lytic murein transglycosylase [Sulfurovum sp.]
MKKLFDMILIALLFPLLLNSNDDRPPIPYDYLSKPNVQRFIRMMHTKYGFDTGYLERTLHRAKLDRDTLARYTGKFKKNSTVGSWERFKLHVVNPETFKEAKAFKQKHYRTLQKAARQYGVDMDYIVGFLGVESRFGTYTGDYNILDALTTLAFHQNRMQKYFYSELKHLFLFAREKHYNIGRLEGSFAGAMGCVQQMPSIARKFNYDFDGDGASVWDIEDCIGSIAKFMHHKGWKNDRTVAVPASFNGKRFKGLRVGFKTRYRLSLLKKHGIRPKTLYPYNTAALIRLRNSTHDELWLGAPNFKVLTAYNASSNYGMAIHKIAQSLK